MAGFRSFWARHRANIMYGVCLAGLMFLLKWLELRFIIFHQSFEIYAGLIAIFFTALGIWLALKLSKPKVRVETVVVEKEVYISPNQTFVPNTSLIMELQLSRRELEILSLMAHGHSNDEIAYQLMVSLSTVKTHNQNLFAKLDVKRRTQAVDKAKRLNIIE